MDKDNKIIYRSYKQSDEANLNSHNMESFVYNGNFRLVECGYAKIDNRWKNIVAYFPYYRIYLITGGSAQLQLKNSTLELEQLRPFISNCFQQLFGLFRTLLFALLPQERNPQCA